MNRVSSRIADLEKELQKLKEQRKELLLKIKSSMETLQSMNVDLQRLTDKDTELFSLILAAEGGLIELKNLGESGHEGATGDKTPKIETI